MKLKLFIFTLVLGLSSTVIAKQNSHDSAQDVIEYSDSNLHIFGNTAKTLFKDLEGPVFGNLAGECSDEPSNNCGVKYGENFRCFEIRMEKFGPKTYGCQFLLDSTSGKVHKLVQ